MSAPLPPALRPWAPWLSGLAPDLALGLSPMVRRLASMLGPMPGRPQPGGVDPDGVSGIGRRGSYDRLLLSEWALAEEAPEEFLRRAAEGEHLFLQLARTEPRVGRRCMVFLDAGPDQLGSPRLAHLALVVVLARRAEEAGAELHLVVIQDEPGLERVRRHGGQVDLLGMLAARSPEDPHQDRLDEWVQVVGPPGPADECWLVGGRRCAALDLPGARRLSVAEPLAEDLLRVRLDARGNAETPAIELPLPSAPVRARLIRNPFVEDQPPAAPTRRATAKGWYAAHYLHGTFHFSHSGKRLLWLDSAGNVVAWRVPDTKGEEPRKPKVENIWMGNQALCAGWHHQRPVVLRMKEDGELVVHNAQDGAWNTLPTTGAEAPVFRPAMAGPALRPLEVVPTPGGGRQLHFVDHLGTLWAWSLAPTEPPRRVLPDEICLCLGRRQERLLHVSYQQGRLRSWLAASLSGDQADHTNEREGCEPFAWLGPNERGTPWSELVMARQAQGRWIAVADQRGPRGRIERVVTLDPDWVVWGCTWAPAQKPGQGDGMDRLRRAALLASPPDRGSLHVVPEPGGVPTLLPTEGPVRFAAASPADRRVAWVEESGHIGIFDLSRQWLLTRLAPPEEES